MRNKLGFLPVFLMVLTMGLFVRFADFSRAVAEEKPKAEAIAEKAAATAKEEMAKADADVGQDEPPPDDELNDSEIDVLRQLADRRRALDAREKSLDQREAVLKAAQSELSKKYGELDKVRAEIKHLLDIQSEAEEKSLASVVKAYENMKPQAAAAILNKLDLSVLLQVMSRMSDRKMSPILAAMDPNRAREVTINLTMQKKLPEAAAPAASAPLNMPAPDPAPAAQ